MNKIEGVELFAPGRWNHTTFSDADVQGIADAYAALRDVHRIPLKFGHNDDQPLTDGQPALGWLDAVRYDADRRRLLGDFVDVPDIVAAAIDQKLYNALSVELDIEVEYKGGVYPYVLSGVALLGADLPAVNVLSDLKHYMPKEKAEGLRHSRTLRFTMNESTKGATMPTIEELQAELAAAKSAIAKFSKEAEDLRAEQEAERKKAAALKFKTDRDALEHDFDALVKAGVIKPAQREGFMRAVKDGDQTSLDAARGVYNTLADGVDVMAFSKKKEQARQEGDDTGAPADQVLAQKIAELRTAQPMSFSAARDRVMRAHPELARAYIELTPEV